MANVDPNNCCKARDLRSDFELYTYSHSHTTFNASRYPITNAYREWIIQPMFSSGVHTFINLLISMAVSKIKAFKVRASLSNYIPPYYGEIFTNPYGNAVLVYFSWITFHNAWRTCELIRIHQSQTCPKIQWFNICRHSTLL